VKIFSGSFCIPEAKPKKRGRNVGRKKIESRMFFGQAVKKETSAPISRKNRGRISKVHPANMEQRGQEQQV